MKKPLMCLLVIAILGVALIPGPSLAQAQKVPRDPAHGLTPINVKTDQVTFKGQQAVRVTDTAPAGTGDEGRLAILTDPEFQSGTIEWTWPARWVPGPRKEREGLSGSHSG